MARGGSAFALTARIKTIILVQVIVQVKAWIPAFAGMTVLIKMGVIPAKAGTLLTEGNPHGWRELAACASTVLPDVVTGR